jgi:glycosyltransferase involved in cell wall biosynthesis
MNKLLTICIPTYKRPATLRRCIDSVVSQIDEFSLSDSVGIHVADDASPDDTAGVLQSFGSLSYFTGVTRKQNLGMNINIKTMLKEIGEVSEFQLIITDDDYLQPSTLGEIVEFLRLQQSDGESRPAIWTPRYSYTEDDELHCIVCNPFDASQAVEASVANAAKYMGNGFVLSGLILRAKFIDYEFWEQYRDNAFFPVIFFGELLLKYGACYWDRNIVHHTVLNECHWENWGKSEVIIDLRLFSDYINGFRILAGKLDTRVQATSFYLSSSTSIYAVLKNFMSSENPRGDKTIFFESVKEQRKNGYLVFDAPTLFLLMFLLPLCFFLSLLKIGITRVLLFATRKSDVVAHYKARIAANRKIISASPIMFKLIFGLFSATRG